MAVSKKARLSTIERYARYRAEYQFNYAVCMKDGPVNKADSGGEYVNMSWAMLNKLDERLLKYDAVFASWTKGLSDEGRPPKALKKPAAADKFLARSQGKILEEYRRELGIEQEPTEDTPRHRITGAELRVVGERIIAKMKADREAREADTTFQSQKREDMTA